MNEKKKARLKDDILRFVSDKGTKGSVYDIAGKLKEDVKLITYLSEELGKEELVRLREVTSRNTEVPREYILSPTNKGIYFLTFDGGHIQRFKDERRDRLWTTVRTIAAIFNALAILAIGIYTVYLSDKTDKLEGENEKLKIEVQKKSK